MNPDNSSPSTVRCTSTNIRTSTNQETLLNKFAFQQKAPAGFSGFELVNTATGNIIHTSNYWLTVTHSYFTLSREDGDGMDYLIIGIPCAAEEAGTAGSQL